MRSHAIVIFSFVATCYWSANSIKGVNASLVQAVQRNPAPAPVKLYTDEEIRKLTKHDIDKESRGGLSFGVPNLDVPCLDVVPNGQSRSRAEVFKALNLNDKRLGGFSQATQERVTFISCQVSPAYDICCMSDFKENRGLKAADPKRQVYGIRLLKREK